MTISENKLAELSGNQVTDSKGEQQKLQELQDEVRRLQLECERISVHNEERESSLQSQKQKILSLQESLSRKECEVASLEERYKKYVEKTKSVIKALDPKQQQGSSAQSPSELASRATDSKRKTLEDVERSYKDKRLIRDMEEKLMISAFYNYALTRHRENVDQRLAALTSSHSQSFLARQRQSTPRKLYTAYNSKW